MVIDLIDKLTIIPSQKSSDFGYARSVEQDAMYALKTPTLWVKWNDPVNHHPSNNTWSAEESTNQEVIYDANKKVFDSQTNVNHAVISGLNMYVPRAYRRVAARPIGAKIYKPSDDPKRILSTLQENYGQMTPAEKRSWRKTGALHGILQTPTN